MVCSATDAFITKVLDRDLLNVKLVDSAKQILGKAWETWEKTAVKAEKDSLRELGNLTFGALHNKPIRFVGLHRPLKRVLCFHATQAKARAIAKGWVDEGWGFQAFWSEGSYEEKVDRWLSFC